MNSGTLRMTGIAGLVWGVLAIAVLLVGIVFVAQAVSSGATTPPTGGSSMMITIASVIAALALCWMLFQLSQVMGGMGAMAAYATIVVTLIMLVMSIAGIASLITIVLVVLQGIGILMVGVFGIMGKRFNSGSYKAFCVLMIITGACLAVVVLAFLYPFLALATGIVLFVAMSGAAKTA